MKSFSILLITTLLSISCFRISAQENPFLEMAGRRYADYNAALDEIAYLNDVLRDSLHVRQLAVQMREAAKVAKNNKWALEADYLEILSGYLRLYYSGSFNQFQKDSLAGIHIQDMRLIVQKAKKIKAFDIELRVLFHSWGIVCNYLKDYEMSFRYASELDRVLSAVTSDAFPPKSYFYSEMGKQYYYFREYETAKRYFEKSLEPPCVNHASSWHSLGLIYRNYAHDLETSDSFFLKILEDKPKEPDMPHLCGAKQGTTYQDVYDLWAAIAKGDLGVNCYLRGDYDNAIPLLQYGTEKAVEDNEYNYVYAIGKVHILSKIFLTTRDFTQAQLYAEKMHTFLTIITGDELALEYWVHYYDFMSRYFRALEDDANAFLYADSTAMARTEYENAFNFHKLHRAMQYVQQEKLDAERLRSETYYNNLIMISVFALLLFLLLAFLYRLYRQKQAAYRVLVVKTQQWAQAPYTQVNQEYSSDGEETENPESQTDDVNDLPTETDQQLFDRFNLLMTEQKIYQNPNLTLHQIAQDMNVNRTYLSQAVNRCTGISFSAFINEFRIKEAVRMMSTPKQKNFSIEGIALDAGFNDRSTFYRVFKKITGFSPTAFRGNLSN